MGGDTAKGVPAECVCVCVPAWVCGAAAAISAGSDQAVEQAGRMLLLG